jgi:hypothetical protein
MSGNPFKDEEPMSVFKDALPEKENKISHKKQENNQENGDYLQFPKWDLLPPFQLIKRRKKQ